MASSVPLPPSDFLNLSNDKDVSKMTFSSGASKPETVFFSDFVEKINKRVCFSFWIRFQLGFDLE